MNMISQAQKDANRLGFTGTLPNGAKGITKDGDTFSVTLADGSVQKYNKDGSIFTPPADSNPKPAGNAENGTGATDGATAKTAVGNTGQGNGATGTSGNGNTGGSIWGNGFTQSSASGGFSVNSFDVNGSFNLDANKFMGASAGLWGVLNLTSAIPLGLGSILGQGLIGKAINNFASAIGYSFDYKSFFAQYDAQRQSQNGTTVTAGDVQPEASGTTQNSGTTGTTGTTDTPATPETPETTNTSQTGGTTGSEATAGTASTSSQQATQSTSSVSKKRTTATASTSDSKPKAKTEAELAKEGGYTKLTNGKYRKNGQIYEYKDGKFAYFADNTFNDGRYVKDGKVYNANGTPSSNTVAMGNSKTMHTLTYFLNDGNEYKQGSYRGMTTLTSKDGTVTRYFDSAGRLVQTNQKDDGGFFGDPINTVNRYKYNKNGVLTSEESSDILKNKTVTTEYNLSGLKAGKTTKNSGVHSEQRMDSQGRVSTYKYQEITTVEVVNYKGKQRRITTVVKQPVK